MGTLQGAVLQVILKIKKGRGFPLMTQPLVIVAALDGVKLETNKLLPSQISNLSAELIWTVDIKYLRRLRKINTAFKIECYILVNAQKRNKLGYIFLNLKNAQISLTSGSNEISTWHNFLGIPRQLRCKAQILLVFKIQEATKVADPKNEVVLQNKLNFVKRMDEKDKSNYLQIGPSKLCSKYYELSIYISEASNICTIIAPNDLGIPLKVQFHIMGMSLETKEFYGFKGIIGKEKFKVRIKSEIQFLAAYFKQFPTITFYLTCDEKIIGSGSLKLQDLTDLREHFTAACKDKVIFKSTDGKDSSIISDCLSPFMKVDVALIPMLPKTESDQGNIPLSIDGSVRKQPISDISILNTKEKADCIYEGSRSNFRVEDPTISCGIIPELEFPEECGKFRSETVGSLEPLENSTDNFLDLTPPINPELQLKRDEIIPLAITPTEDTKATMQHPQHVDNQSQDHNVLVQQNSATPVGMKVPSLKDMLPKAYVEQLATKYIEELEDWKEKQQEMFKFELKRKRENHLSKLSSEWSKRQQSIENDYVERLDALHSLKNRLEDVLVELELKLNSLNKLEQEVHFGKNELDRKYTSKFRELRKASKKHQFDMDEKIKQCDIEKVEFKNVIKDKGAEISRLHKLLASESSNRLSIEESKKLLAEKEALEQKLDKAMESKNYFKEQCYIAVRYITKLKEEKEDNEKMQIKKDEEGRNLIGLVEEINNEVDEMRKDQSTLKALRSEIVMYGNT